MKQITILVVIAVAGLSGGAPATALAAPSETPEPGVEAVFEGHTIDLSAGWGAARACAVTPAGVSCYRTEAEMDAALAEAGSAVGVLASSCASSLRLYDGTSYSGSVVFITTRLVGINLSPLGFDNLTSSYKVGACDVDMYAGANLGGSLYPGNTNAGAQASTMLSGWNNTISSVYIL